MTLSKLIYAAADLGGVQSSEHEGHTVSPLEVQSHDLVEYFLACRVPNIYGEQSQTSSHTYLLVVSWQRQYKCKSTSSWRK
jgi:hypothetical protein